MPKVLIVDDSQTIRAVLKKALETPEMTLVEAVDGVEGLKRLEDSGPFDLVISDINMPNMDGITMISKIKENPTHKALPCMVISTEVGTEMKEKGKKLGVIAWVAKPPDAVKLSQAVNKIIAMTKAQ